MYLLPYLFHAALISIIYLPMILSSISEHDTPVMGQAYVDLTAADPVSLRTHDVFETHKPSWLELAWLKPPPPPWPPGDEESKRMPRKWLQSASIAAITGEKRKDWGNWSVLWEPFVRAMSITVTMIMLTVIYLMTVLLADWWGVDVGLNGVIPN